MKIVIRVDSSTQIGSGHLMRCLTLAKQKRKENNEVIFIMRDLVGNLAYLAEQEGFAVKILPRAEGNASLTGYAVWLTVSKDRDASETIAVIRNLGNVDLLIIDSYALDIEWEQQLRPFVKQIFVIDDLADRRHDCDFLLDQNFYLDAESRYEGLVPKSCELRLGYKYALLREEFYAAKKTLRKRNGLVRNILVFYGGVDLTNETMKALRALKQLHEEGKEFTATVVVGGSNAKKAEVKEFCKEESWTEYYCQVNNMAELMAKADLALGAGGTTIWERLFLDLPSIVTAIADNQVQVAKDCAEEGLIEYIGRNENVDEATIAQVVKKRFTDGYLRDVTFDDAKILFDWRNDKVTRENSFNTSELVYEDHEKWLKRVLEDKSIYFYILMNKNVPVGQIRIVPEDGEYMISYSIDTNFRGQGYGLLILQLAEREMIVHNIDGVLAGEVKTDNIASCRAFERLGYSAEKQEQYIIYRKMLEAK